MRPHRVVMFPPLFDDNLRFFQGVKDLAVKQFVSEAGIDLQVKIDMNGKLDDILVGTD